MRLRKRIQTFLLIVTTLALTFANLPVKAQVTTGSLNVEVKDEDGAKLPGATVAVSNNFFNRTSVTDTTGTARFISLPAGTYKATATLDGFNGVVKENIDVKTGETENICLTLTLATVKEELIVTAEAPIVDGTSTMTLDTLPEAFPEFPVSSRVIKGLADGEKFIGIDWFMDSGTNLLKGVSNFGNFYLIDDKTGNASPIGTVPIPSGMDKFGFDFDPLTKKFRMGFGVKNIEYDSFTGQTEVNSDFRYASGDRNANSSPDVVALAYNNVFTGATSNTLYGIDANNDCLFMTDDPDSGLISTVLDFDHPVTNANLDINAANKAKATIQFRPSHSVQGAYAEVLEIDLRSFNPQRDDPREIKAGQYTGILTASTFVEAQYSERDFCIASSVSETMPLNGSRSFTTTTLFEGQPLSGMPVNFMIASGPNEGRVGTAVTDANGNAAFSYSNNGQKGTDTILIISSILGEETTCTARTNWTDEPVITGSKIKATLNKIKISGFNFSLWDITGCVNGVDVKTKVKDDGSIVLKKTRDTVFLCTDDLFNTIVLRYDPIGPPVTPIQDTQAFATCP